jgi:hypothetical protein
MLHQSRTPDFTKDFHTEDECREFLYNMKWKKGFVCSKCGHSKFWKGRTKFNRRCRSCRYDESVLANTVFHKIKIPLIKAFRIVNQFSLTTGGVSSTDLARQYNINQKTAWLFKRKLQQALTSANQANTKKAAHHKFFIVDSLLISGRTSGSNGLQQVILVTEKSDRGKKKGKQISAKSIMPLDEKKLLSDLVKGKFKQTNPSIRIWNFKVGFTGTYHHCSEKHLQGYVDEFMFKSCNRHRGNGIWYLLMQLLINPNQKNQRACKLNG